MRQAGTWGPCCNAAKLAPVHASWATKYKETTEIKINSVHEAEANSGAKDTKTFLKSRVQIHILRMSPCIQYYLRVGKPAKLHPPARNPCLEFLSASSHLYWLEKAKNHGCYHKYWIKSYFTVPSVTSVSFLGVTDCKVQLYWNFSWLRDSRSSYTFPTK